MKNEKARESILQCKFMHIHNEKTFQFSTLPFSLLILSVLFLPLKVFLGSFTSFLIQQHKESRYCFRRGAGEEEWNLFIQFMRYFHMLFMRYFHFSHWIFFHSLRCLFSPFSTTLLTLSSIEKFSLSATLQRRRVENRKSWSMIFLFSINIFISIYIANVSWSDLIDNK